MAGPHAYISPNWYPFKTEHHRVVPTTNYELLHIRGVITVHHEPHWKHALVAALTDQHEGIVNDAQHVPWHVNDAPAEFIDKQLAAIVGIEITLSSTELKQKMSQNKPDPDRLGAASGLRTAGGDVAQRVADLMDPDGH